MFISILALIMVITLLNIMSTFLKTMKMKNREKTSNFECGFDPEHKMRTTFSLRFFLITVVFLIFDLEIIMMLPTPFINLALLNTKILYMNYTLFIFLCGSLIYEWTQKTMTWN